MHDTLACLYDIKGYFIDQFMGKMSETKNVGQHLEGLWEISKMVA